jgi:hypothetical protein
MSESIYPIISRKEAIQQGLKYYFTGKPCKHGHITKRILHNGTCSRCAIIRCVEWNKQKEITTQYMKHWHENHIEQVNQTTRRYYHDNKEQKLESNNQYRKDNTHKVNACVGKRRATRVLATPSWYEQDKIEFLFLKAREWSEILGCKIQVDHIIPLTNKKVCGLHCFDNLQLLERSINIKKSNKFKTDW